MLIYIYDSFIAHTLGDLYRRGRQVHDVLGAAWVMGAFWKTIAFWFTEGPVVDGSSHGSSLRTVWVDLVSARRRIVESHMVSIIDAGYRRY